jgi:hypothetical protein
MSEALAHSKYSASGFEAAMLCPGKTVLEVGKTEKPKIYSATGTLAHTILSESLDGAYPAAKHLGEAHTVEGFKIEVDQEMVAAVQTAIDAIREIVGDGWLLSEQRVNYSTYLGVPTEDGWGTSDIIALRGAELQVHDYKDGRGVEVYADENPQMLLYALGALVDVRALGEEPTTVRLVIHQPRIKSAPSEWTCTVAWLENWGKTTARSAVITRINAATLIESSDKQLLDDKVWQETFLRPNDKSCKFCKAKATCPAMRAAAIETVFASTPATPEDFADLPVKVVQHIKPADSSWLAAALAKADLIEDWLSAVRAEVLRRLETGDKVPGYKLVAGKRGNRAWSNADEAEAQLKTMRLKAEDMYDLKLISPTTAEKLTAGEKPVIGPRQWAKVKALITQADGKPSVAPLCDKRPALDVAPVAESFSDVTIPATTEETYA